MEEIALFPVFLDRLLTIVMMEFGLDLFEKRQSMLVATALLQTSDRTTFFLAF